MPLRAADGVMLGATWFVPAQVTDVQAAAVIAPGAGIPAAFYHGLAEYLASRSIATLTFDYRGIGASRPRRLRGYRAGMEHWAERDIEAALRGALTQYPRATLTVVAHSVGTLLVGGAPSAERVARAVFLGPHTGFWGDYASRWRLPLFATWHLLMPALTHAFGFFPGRAIGLGEDLPHDVALDWAHRRAPELVRTPRDRERFGAALPRYARFRAATLVLSIEDDAFAPAVAARRLLAMYPNMPVTQETVSPKDTQQKQLGHLGFLRRAARAVLWPRIASWLLAPGSPS